MKHTEGKWLVPGNGLRMEEPTLLQGLSPTLGHLPQRPSSLRILLLLLGALISLHASEGYRGWGAGPLLPVPFLCLEPPSLPWLWPLTPGPTYLFQALCWTPTQEAPPPFCPAGSLPPSFQAPAQKGLIGFKSILGWVHLWYF